MRADQLHSNRLPCSFEARNYHLFVLSFVPVITRKIVSFTVKRSFGSLHGLHGTSKYGQKMSLMHVTMKAGVNYASGLA